MFLVITVSNSCNFSWHVERCGGYLTSDNIYFITLITAIIMSASATPASSSVFGEEPMPLTVLSRIYHKLLSVDWLESTTVISLDSLHKFAATEVPTCPCLTYYFHISSDFLGFRTYFKIASFRTGVSSDSYKFDTFDTLC